MHYVSKNMEEGQEKLSPSLLKIETFTDKYLHELVVIHNTVAGTMRHYAYLWPQLLSKTWFLLGLTAVC